MVRILKKLAQDDGGMQLAEFALLLLLILLMLLLAFILLPGDLIPIGKR